MYGLWSAVITARRRAKVVVRDRWKRTSPQAWPALNFRYDYTATFHAHEWLLYTAHGAYVVTCVGHVIPEGDYRMVLTYPLPLYDGHPCSVAGRRRGPKVRIVCNFTTCCPQL